MYFPYITRTYQVYFAHFPGIPTLAPLYDKRCELGDTLNENGVKWEIRHIYREYNQAADALSNEAIDEPERRWTTADW